MESSVADLLADALEHYRRGRLAEAEACYLRVIARAPEQPDALHRLGIIARLGGRNEVALSLIERAIAAQPRHPAYYNEAGIVLHALGRSDEAAGRFRTALSLAPNDVAALNNLGNILRERGNPAEAAHAYRRALALAPGSTDLWYNLASALSEQGANDDATCAYAHALVLEETPETIAAFVRSLVAAEHRHGNEDVRRMAIRALVTPWTRPSELAAACIRLVAAAAPMRACIDRAWNAWPSRLTLHELFGDERDAAFGDSLLRTLLESAPVCDLHMERLLTQARYALLDALARGCLPADEYTLSFCCALARQCFINDYVFCFSAPEFAQACALRDAIGASSGAGEAPAAMRVAVVAAYFPLCSLAQAESLLEGNWPEPLGALLVQQLREPLEERRCRDRLSRLTAVDDAVSVAVRQQYEEHPYPRWVRLPAAEASTSAAWDPGARYPIELRRTGDQGSSLEILVAGCGTGQESIELARAFPRGRVLAVDLSLGSLGYAERKSRELGIGNVEHAQADILGLGALARKFDVIASVGVLHHLADPLRGWRELVSLLAPGGHMLIGLYSERGREDVVAARAFIAERGYLPSADDIRRCRQDLMSVDGGERFSHLASRTDFYVTGECRDLLFHVREHRFALPQIRGSLAALGLRFNGFLLSAELAARYAQRHPDDPGMENLDNWDAFETKFPDAFAGMYIFWVRKGP